MLGEAPRYDLYYSPTKTMLNESKFKTHQSQLSTKSKNFRWKGIVEKSKIFYYYFFKFHLLKSYCNFLYRKIRKI
jgi:hypothetical protein